MENQGFQQSFDNLVTSAKEGNGEQFQHLIDNMSLQERHTVLQQFADTVNKNDNDKNPLPMIELVFDNQKNVREMKVNTEDSAGTVWSNKTLGEKALDFIVGNAPVSSQMQTIDKAVSDAQGNK